jgi:hypothetical protein
MLFVILIVVLVLLLAVLASALPSPSKRSSARPQISTQSPTLNGKAIPMRNFSGVDDATQFNRSADEVEEQEFVPLGKVTPEPIDPQNFAGFFFTANGPFKPGRRIDNDDSMCFVTGQSKAVCDCNQCLRRRSSHVG